MKTDEERLDELTSKQKRAFDSYIQACKDNGHYVSSIDDKHYCELSYEEEVEIQNLIEKLLK